MNLLNILTPITITDAMVGAGTSVAEPAAGETLWVSGGNYALGVECIRATTHRVYECVQAHSGRVALPENDSAYWLVKRPTQRWSPFDAYRTTAAVGTTSMTFVVKPGYFNAAGLYGLVGSVAAITLKDAPGGTVIDSRNISLLEAPAGWWEFLFLPLRQIPRLVLTNLPIRPDAELTITISAAAGAAVAISMINVGDFKSIIGDAEWGGTLDGAAVEPISNSFIKTYPDGTLAIQRRNAATNLRASMILPIEQAKYALSCVQEVLDVPVSWVSDDDELNVFGLGSGSLTYDEMTAQLDINIKGMI